MVNHLHDKDKKIWAKIVAKAWSDELFRQKLIKNPKAVFQEYGLPAQEGINYHIHVNDKQNVHITLPSPSKTDLSEEELKKVSGGLCQGCLPAPSDW